MASSNVLREKVQNKIMTISSKFHYEPLTAEIAGKKFPRNLSLMALSYILNGNHLIVGDPGWGKTTSAKIFASVFSGVPYDIYDKYDMRGNPQAYEEKRIARPQYGALNQGVEKVIFFGTLATPVTIVDEINRFSYEMQDIYLQGIDTGVWTYLNAYHDSGKKPTFATANYRDEGNGHLIPPLQDRMLIITEEGYNGRSNFGDYKAARDNVKAALCDKNAAKKASEAFNSGGIEAFEDALGKSMLKNVSPLTDGEKQEILEQISKIPLAYKDADLGKSVNDPLLYLASFAAEINYSDQFFAKRSTDPISINTHDQSHVGINVIKSMSPRTQITAEYYIPAFAWLMGNDKVTIEHVKFMLPHLVGHKLEFTDDYIEANAHDKRTNMTELHLAKKIVDAAYDNYSKAGVGIKNLLSEIQKYLGKKDYAAIEKLKPDDYDHPYMKELVREAQEAAKNGFGTPAKDGEKL